MNEIINYIEKKLKEKNPIIIARFSKNSKSLGLNLKNEKVRKYLLKQFQGNK